MRQQQPNVDREKKLDSLTLLDIWALVRRHKFILVVPVVVFVSASLVYALKQPNRFRGHAVIALEVPASFTTTYNPTLTAQGQLAMVRETMNRRSFLEPVIDEFGLYETNDGRANERSLEQMRSRVRLSVEGPLSFEVSFEDTDPAVAAGVVGRIAERFIEQSESTSESRTEAQISRLGNEVASAEQELEGYQQQLEAYKNRGNGKIPENLEVLIASLNRSTSQLQDINKSIVSAEGERAGVLEEIRLLEALGYDQPSASPAAQSARRLDLQRQLDAARERYTDQHPEVIRLEAELAKLDPESAVAPASGNAADMRPRYIQLKASLERLDTQLGFLNEEKDRLRGEIDGYQRQTDSISGYEQELSLLMRDYENARARYLDRVDQLAEARMDARVSGGGAISFRVAEPARIPESKSGPSRSRIVLMGMLLGIFTGVALLLVRHQMDSSFDDVDGLRRFTGITTIASIPKIRLGLIHRNKAAMIPTATDVGSVASEQYRILTLRLRNMIDRECAQVVLVTSSAGGEGKTTTAVNIAIALSEMQQEKVLLIDADLRKPHVRQTLGLAGADGLGPEGGLRQALRSPKVLPLECFGRFHGLYVLAAAEGTANSGAEVTADGVRQAFARFRKQFKYIVIDSPPLLPMVDSHLLAEIADRVLLIVRANKTRRETLARTLDSFDLSKVVGMVLNSVDFSQARYGRAYDKYAKEYLQAAKGGRSGVKLRFFI